MSIEQNGTTVDTCCFVGHWPLRPVSGKVDQLLAEMDQVGISLAWVSPLHAFFYDDPHEANEELQTLLEPHPDRLLPVPVVRPGFPLWMDELTQYTEQWGVRVIRLLPGFHEWQPEGKSIDSLKQFAVENGLIIILQCRVEDVRSFHGLVKPSFPSLEQILLFCEDYSGKVILSGVPFHEAKRVLATSGKNVFIELSYIDKTRGLEELADDAGTTQLLFGAMFPLLSAQSAMLKVQCSTLTECQKQDILKNNATQLLALR